MNYLEKYIHKGVPSESWGNGIETWNRFDVFLMLERAAQQSVKRTAITVGTLCGLAGFIIGWLVFGG